MSDGNIKNPPGSSNTFDIISIKPYLLPVAKFDRNCLINNIFAFEKVMSPDDTLDKNVIIWGVDNSCSMHVGNKKKKILALGASPAQELDDSTIIAEVKYPINFKQ